MSATLEAFSKAHESSIAAAAAVGTVLAAFATVAAVLVSLHLARRSERVRLKVLLSVVISNTTPTTQYACVIITNVGMRAAWLPILFFEWRIPFRRRQQPEAIANWINAVSANNPNREIKVGQDTFLPVGGCRTLGKR
jgi:hypothetical protein